MSAKFGCRFILYSLVLFISFHAQSQFKVNAARTWVFMVGVLEWADKNDFASFDKSGRLDAKIFQFFKNSGVPTHQMLYLQDKQATTSEVRKALTAFLKKSQKEDILFFYYCGHGYKNEAEKVCFANYQGGDWSAQEIVKNVAQNFAGNTAFFTADCCNSGGLAREVQKYPTKNFVALNSVVPTDVSTGNWTFSSALLYGLQGKNFIDTNNDTQITISELAGYIDQEMAIVEGQKAAYYVPENMANWVVATDVTSKKNKRIGEHVWVNYDGEDYLGFIVDANQNTYQVRFFSYTNNETDWVAAKQLKPFRCKKDFAVGSAVQVYYEDDKKWYAAKVLKKFSCLHYVHYEGYSNEYDAWISPDNIKKN